MFLSETPVFSVFDKNVVILGVFWYNSDNIKSELPYADAGRRAAAVTQEGIVQYESKAMGDRLAGHRAGAGAVAGDRLYTADGGSAVGARHRHTAGCGGLPELRCARTA